MSAAQFSGLEGGDVFLVCDSVSKTLVSVALCLSSQQGDVLVSTIDPQGLIKFVPIHRYIQSLPSERFVECVWMDEWDESGRANATRAALDLMRRCCRSSMLEDWLVDSGGIQPNDALELWWWTWRNPSLYREMCVVTWALVAATKRKWDWSVLCPARFCEWVRTSNSNFSI